MWIDKYRKQVAQDLARANEVLAESLPQEVKQALEEEHRILLTLQQALDGQFIKSVLHQMRAELRYARQRLKTERDPAKRRELQAEISRIERDIAREAEKKGSRK